MKFVYRSPWFLRPLIEIYFKRLTEWKNAYLFELGRLEFYHQTSPKKDDWIIDKIKFSKMQKDLKVFTLFCKKNDNPFRVSFLKDLQTKNLVVQILDLTTNIEDIYIKKM